MSLVLLTVSTSSGEAFKLGIKSRVEEIRKKETKYLTTIKVIVTVNLQVEVPLGLPYSH